jgi:hypothetical protein
LGIGGSDCLQLATCGWELACYQPPTINDQQNWPATSRLAGQPSTKSRCVPAANKKAQRFLRRAFYVVVKK